MGTVRCDVERSGSATVRGKTTHRAVPSILYLGAEARTIGCAARHCEPRQNLNKLSRVLTNDRDIFHLLLADNGGLFA